MLLEERKFAIMELIKRDGFVSVRQLMDILGVSRSSVMRDLDELERQGLVVRQRGGASLTDTSEILSKYNEPATRDKVSTNSDIKRRICKKAAALIKSGDCIFIDSGTTVLPIMDYILSKEVDIVTYNMQLLDKITEDFKGTVIVLGGIYSPKSSCNYGPITFSELDNYHFDHVFLTANGIDFDMEEIYGFNLSYAGIKKAAMKKSESASLLVDSSKLKVKGLCQWANVFDFDHIFIDQFTGENKPENVEICD